MSRQLPIDCVNEIFKCLENDKNTLFSCLFVNRHYCKFAVRILWKNIWDIRYEYRPYVTISLISTLITCLPKKSKEFLRKKGMFINISSQKPPLFNYPSFCRIISVNTINEMIQNILVYKQLIITSGDSYYDKYLLSLLLQEILKMFMEQIPSLKSLKYFLKTKSTNCLEFIYSPEAKVCLYSLTELGFYSDIHSEFFYHLSHICQNIQSLSISFSDNGISDGLAYFISSQNNLKSLKLSSCSKNELRTIIPSLVKSSLTLTKLRIHSSDACMASFISMFMNLQKLVLISESKDFFDDFDQLQHINFPHLRTLKFPYSVPKAGPLLNFLEINGKYLNKYYVCDCYESMKLAIAKFCPNLKGLYVIISEEEDDLESLKLILKNCQFLESINASYSYKHLKSKEFYEILVNYSPKNFHKLEMNLFSLQGFEEFFINWKNRIPQRSLTLIIQNTLDNIKNKASPIIEKYHKMGVIKKFKI
ncbi:hypothetical protein RhiirB3_465480 [Rhizophagus irregularis]|nr:hypothetical protein RhiirB3_465480 [Rhizophagus irregularis]